jgi:hypothetical protein
VECYKHATTISVGRMHSILVSFRRECLLPGKPGDDVVRPLLAANRNRVLIPASPLLQDSRGLGHFFDEAFYERVHRVAAC